MNPCWPLPWNRKHQQNCRSSKVRLTSRLFHRRRFGLRLQCSIHRLTCFQWHGCFRMHPLTIVWQLQRDCFADQMKRLICRHWLQPDWFGRRHCSLTTKCECFRFRWPEMNRMWWCGPLKHFHLQTDRIHVAGRNSHHHGGGGERDGSLLVCLR